MRRSRREDELRVIYEVAVIELVDIGDNFLAESTNPRISFLGEETNSRDR